MIIALVPVKRLSQAKVRLAPALNRSQRRSLSLAMLQDVLSALLPAAELGGVAVISCDHDALREAAQMGARPIEEPAGIRDLNEALTYGAQLLRDDGTRGLLVTPADLPDIDPLDLSKMLARVGSGPKAILCPSQGGGTGALYLAPPDAIPFRFGPESAFAHERAARALGLSFESLVLPSLARDIDTPEDLDRFVRSGRSGRSYSWLIEAGLAPAKVI